MAKGGFELRASLDLWKNMERAGGAQPVEFLSTHPTHATRMQDLQQKMPVANEMSRQARAAGKNPQCDRLRLIGQR